MSEPIVPIRTPAIALAVSILMLAGCQREEAPRPAVGELSKPVAVEGPPQVLTRADLLQAVDQAASDYAAGRGEGNQNLAGRRFLIRQAFGCGAPFDPSVNGGIEEGTGGLVRDVRAAGLKLTLTPADWTHALSTEGRTDAFEAAEGFWLSWPWLRADGCPRLAREAADGDGAPAEPHRASPQSVGLAAVFDKDGSRLGRRNGRAYEIILREVEDEAPSADPGGYRVVFEGRMAAFGDGRSIHCRATQPEQRPVCIVAVRLERVAFETAEGRVLGEWRS